MNFEYLETERLKLRKLTDELYELILTTKSDQEIMDLLCIAPKDLEKEKQKAVRGFGMFNKSMLLFQLIEKESNNVIGWCGYHTWFTQHHRAELGYMLYTDEVKQKGYMKEALKPIIGYGFNNMGLNRIEALIEPKNLPSLKLIKHFNFKEEGLLKNHYLKNGVYEDSMYFGLLAHDYHTKNNKTHIG